MKFKINNRIVEFDTINGIKQEFGRLSVSIDYKEFSHAKKLNQWIVYVHCEGILKGCQGFRSKALLHKALEKVFKKYNHTFEVINND